MNGSQSTTSSVATVLTSVEHDVLNLRTQRNMFPWSKKLSSRSCYWFLLLVAYFCIWDLGDPCSTMKINATPTGTKFRRWHRCWLRNCWWNPGERYTHPKGHHRSPGISVICGEILVTHLSKTHTDTKWYQSTISISYPPNTKPFLKGGCLKN